SEIATFEEQGVHSLLSGNLMDVCPVGAITTRDYRFKSRPWDNPSAVDTICTFCEKGCNTTVWLRAKPEWAQSARLARITPRLNPDVNQYWMCDIGRFGYDWVESDARLTQPLVKDGGGTHAATAWDAAISAVGEALKGAASGVRFLLSAHASHEELFVFARLGQELLGDAAQQAFTVSWTTSEKSQPANTKFPVPPVDAPNVAGARLLGLTDAPAGAAADTGALRAAVDAGSVSTLYVFDPGPDGSLGDVAWIVEARAAGRIKTLIVQGVLMSPLAAAAAIVLPGSSFVEKDASYATMQGRLQFTSQAIPAPGDARDDVLLVVEAARAAGAELGYASADEVRRAIAGTLP